MQKIALHVNLISQIDSGNNVSDKDLQDMFDKISKLEAEECIEAFNKHNLKRKPPPKVPSKTLITLLPLKLDSAPEDPQDTDTITLS